jgi:predicted DNA-binding protein with PD1-like motif
MAILKNLKSLDVYMGRLTKDGDLLEEITNFCIKENIRLGWLEAIGAVKMARLGFYNQEAREYQYITFKSNLEITKLAGNVSIKDDKPMVHAHVTLADDKGNCYGGHLATGTIVFACEVIVQAFDEMDFIRAYDKETGLPLWNIME